MPAKPRIDHVSIGLLGILTICAYGSWYYSFGVLLDPIRLDTGWREIGSCGLVQCRHRCRRCCCTRRRAHARPSRPPARLLARRSTRLDRPTYRVIGRPCRGVLPRLDDRTRCVWFTRLLSRDHGDRGAPEPDGTDSGDRPTHHLGSPCVGNLSARHRLARRRGRLALHYSDPRHHHRDWHSSSRLQCFRAGNDPSERAHPSRSERSWPRRSANPRPGC